ncbi:MAG: hypothetical protein IT422_28495 [Pirellulaceae bacterium]|nr:hypothetical protein [Pirellulaceae bacterium]
MSGYEISRVHPAPIAATGGDWGGMDAGGMMGGWLASKLIHQRGKLAGV